jgi:hypothetical protein
VGEHRSNPSLGAADLSAFSGGNLYGDDGALIVEPEPVVEVAAYPFLHGWRRTHEGASLLSFGTPAAGDPYVNGFRHTARGARYATTDAVGATTNTIGGVAVSSTGQMHITYTLPSPLFRVGGFATDEDGVVYVADSMSLLSFMTEYWDGLTTPSVTIAGQGVSEWGPVIGSHSFTQGTDGARPTFSGGVLSFNGTDEYMATGAFAVSQPYTVFIAANQVSYTAGDVILGLDANALIWQNGVSPDVVFVAATSNVNGGPLTLGSFGVITAIGNGASSSAKINLSAAVVGDAGTQAISRLVVGAEQTPSAFAAIQVKGLGYASVALTAAQVEQTVRAIARRYGISV